MPFYSYRQNNSGGSWDIDESAGISVLVIVEADSADDANDRAERIGLYFDGCDSGRDCSCCGDRWSSAWSDDADDVPRYYRGDEITPGQVYPAKDTDAGRWGKSLAEGTPDGFIHYKDGRVESFWTTTAERQDLDGSFGYGVNFGPNWDTPLVFMVTSNGYDEEGNRRAANGKKGDIFTPWEKPTKATVEVDAEYHFLRAWFPNEEQAKVFAEFLTSTNATVNDAINSTLDEIGKTMKTATLRSALTMWKK